jgi:hypothetical protein|tara:strand:- start:9590 stop:14290 length:4701 start_codon:yes stop_codon:yes gene_type:complete
MAESKNNFIRARMNQDLDDRLIPQGEYRVGQNLTISRSEGDDVGTFQNILGNSSLSKFGIDSTAQHINTEVIGYLNDESNDRIFVFLTNYTDSSSDQLSNKAKNGSSHFIIRYDTLTNTSVRLVEGSFLNFSKTHPVLGVNLIENLLFFTDNRNQPRKINIVSASSDISYYDSEDKISIVKFYPYNPPKFYNEIILTALNSSTDTSSSGGIIIEIATQYPTSVFQAAGVKIGSPISLKVNNSSPPDGLLGRDIYVDLFSVNTSANKLSIFLNKASTWAAGDKIIISTYGLKNCSSPFLPVIFNCELDMTNVSNGTYGIQDANGNDPIFQGASSNYSQSEIYVASDTGYAADRTITASEGFKLVGYNTGNNVITIKDSGGNSPPDLDGTNVNFFRDNPDYDPNFVGDPEYLKDKFVRFSYRYKFDDNEYSLMAPFTQIAFTPKQFGNFIGSDESDAGKTSVVNFMENNVDCVEIFVNTPFKPPADFFGLIDSTQGSWNETIDKLNIKEIEILCRFSGETSIKIVDVLEVTKIRELSEQGTFSFLKYNYQSTKPIRVLPENAVTRVFDKAPIKALSQEVSGNRVMYGNFLDKHSSPLNLNYRLAVIKKPDIPLTQDKRTLLNHTLKENRTYQVGLVLQDRYGRSSDVILSNLKDQSIGALNTKFGASTVYNPYSTVNDFSAEDILNFTGKQLMIELEDDIPNTLPINGYPGLYSEENPLGWFSYKIVVQQQEQEYYNVYIPNSVSKRQLSGNNSLDVSYFSLINDNINKVPKDLTNVGPEEKEFRSSVKLFPRVNPSFLTVNSTTEQESFFITPLRDNDEVNSIIYNTPNLTQADLSLATGSVKGLSEISPQRVYKGTTATLAQIFNNKPFGSIYGDSTPAQIPNFNILGVYETSGFKSNLDIYYETSTSGLVSDLNASVNDETNAGPVDLTPDVMSLVENTPIYELGTGTISSPEFGDVIYTVEVKDYLGIAILNATNTCRLLSVREANLGSSSVIRAGAIAPVSGGSSNAVSASGFIIVPQVDLQVPPVNTGRFDLYAKQYFYADDGRTFDFTIEFGVLTSSGAVLTKNFTFSGVVNNIKPQYNQQANPGSPQLGDEFIPVDLEPYSDYSRMTGGSSPKSLKPHYYKSPNAGDNKAPQGLGESPQKGAFPFLCFLDTFAFQVNDYPRNGNVFVNSGNATTGAFISTSDRLTVDTYFYKGLAGQFYTGQWGLGTNAWLSETQNAQDSGGSFQTNMVSPYVSQGGMGDQNSMWSLFQMTPAEKTDPAMSAVAFWRKLLYGSVGTEASLTSSTPTFDNYPFQHIYNTNQNSNERYTPAILKLPTDQFLPNIHSDFYSLINYESQSNSAAIKGPWNILEQNQLVSKFTNINGGVNFLNGTRNTSSYQRDIRYGTSVNVTAFSGNVHETFELKDLHFPTGDVFNSPLYPTGRFVDDGTQNPNSSSTPTPGAIESALRKSVNINNQGQLGISSYLLLDDFGFDGDLNYLIPPTVPSTSKNSNWFGGILLNNRLGHGNLYNVGHGIAATLPQGVYPRWVPHGSYGIFWIGFTLQATDKWGTVTSVPMNILIIA